MIHPPASLCMNFGYRFVLVNSLLIIFFVKFVLPTKHLIPISSLQLFLFILRGLYFEAESFSLSFPLFYSITTIHILCDCHVLYTFHRHIPFPPTDPSTPKQFIVISALLLIVYRLILFPSFPTIMSLSKFSFPFLSIHHSLGFVSSPVIMIVVVIGFSSSFFSLNGSLSMSST